MSTVSAGAAQIYDNILLRDRIVAVSNCMTNSIGNV